MPEQLALPFDTPIEDMIEGTDDTSDDGSPFDRRTLAKVSGWVLRGIDTYTIIESCAETFGIPEADALRYIRRVRRAIRVKPTETQQERLYRMVRERMAIYADAMRAGELADATRVLKDINHLLGDYPDRVIRNIVGEEKKTRATATVRDVITAIPPRLRHLFAKDLKETQPVEVEADDDDD